MAAVLTQSNSFRLTGKIGRRPTDGELYMAHFMGVGGAAKLISNAEDNPQASGARLFPNAAAANRSIFFDRAGRARSVSEVYSVLTSRYASAANSPATRTAMASVGDTPASARRSPAQHRPLRRSTMRPICRLFRMSARLRRWPRWRLASTAMQRLAADRPDLPLAVPGRRASPAGLAGGAGIMGQWFVADVGAVGADAPTTAVAPQHRSRQRPLYANAQRSHRPARSQRPHRLFQRRRRIRHCETFSTTAFRAARRA